MARLSEAQVTAALARLPGWRRQGDALVKQFAFEGFPDAVAALVRLAFHAEAADHHPDVTVTYRRLTVSYTTHSAGGLTQKDVDGAARAEQLLAR